MTGPEPVPPQAVTAEMARTVTAAVFAKFGPKPWTYVASSKVPRIVRDVLEAAAPHLADAPHWSALAQVEAPGICSAEVTTFLELKLECESKPAHAGLHLDIDQGIWWAHADEADGDPVAAERERCAQLAEQHDARYRKPVYTPVASIPPTMNLDVTWTPFAALLREARP